MASVYDVLHRSLAAAVTAGEVTPDQARLASLWLDVNEATDQEGTR